MTTGISLPGFSYYYCSHIAFDCVECCQLIPYKATCNGIKRGQLYYLLKNFNDLHSTGIWQQNMGTGNVQCRIQRYYAKGFTPKIKMCEDSTTK